MQYAALATTQLSALQRELSSDESTSVETQGDKFYTDVLAAAQAVYGSALVSVGPWAWDMAAVASFAICLGYLLVVGHVSTFTSGEPAPVHACGPCLPPRVWCWLANRSDRPAR